MAVLMEENSFASPQSKDNATSAMTVVIAAIVSVVICLVTVITTFIIFRRFSKSICGGSLPCLESKDQRTGYYPYLSSSTTTTTLTPPTPGDQDQAQYCLRNECQVLRPLMITPIGPNSTIYRATFANGQQAHVIPISQQSNNTAKNFRPITPSASHIYMEIDPVYNSETLSDILVSDLSDDDLRRSSDDGRKVQDLQAGQYPAVSEAAGHAKQVNCISTVGEQRCDSNVCDRSASDFNGVGVPVDLPISSTYTGTGQQLLRLDLKGQSQQIHNFGQFNQFGQSGPLVHTWQRNQNHNHVFQ